MTVAAPESPERRGNGTVVAVLAGGQYIVELDSPAGYSVMTYTAGKLRKHHVRVKNGDRVTVELSPYDMERGRITERES